MRTWRYLYLVWAVLCISGGYRTLLPDRTVDFAFGWSFIATGFLFFCIAPLAITALKQRFGVEMTFRRPSLDRSPFSWGRDPLQVFRLFLVSSVFVVAWSQPRTPQS